MGTIKAGDTGKGTCLLVKDAPYIVTEREFVNPGKGAAFVRLKLKNLRDGRVIQQVNKTHETLEEIAVEQSTYQYLYKDETNYVFMDTETYEQVTVPVSGMEEKKNFLIEGQNVKLLMWEDTAIDIVLPYKMVLTVTQAENGEKGDTVSGATKTVTVQTGLTVKTPLFIRQGDRILINTESYEYVERVNT
jgi:elongation factor P